MECAAGPRTGRRTYTGRAHGQTDQRRVSLRGLDPAGQYHDAGAGHQRAAPAGVDHQCASAVTASHAHAGGGEKAETAARALRTGFDCTGTSTGTGSCRRE